MSAMIVEFEERNSSNAVIKVIGVGGGGGNAVNRMIEEQLSGVEFISVNTDAQALHNSRANVKIQIGRKLTNGLGAGARPDVGRQSIEENREEVSRLVAGADLVFVTCGMGGGTGTGAAPVIAELAREAKALTVGIVTKPFLFEGRKRMRQAELGISELRKHVDTMIVVPNERLLAVVGRGMPFQDALKKADEVLLQATSGISGIINTSSTINVDFADVRTVMQNGGSALMGSGVGRGENRAMEAAQQAIASPLLDSVSITGAQSVLINIVGGPDLQLGEVQQIAELVQESVGDDAEIIFGGDSSNPAMEGEIRVTLIATGFDRALGHATPDFRPGIVSASGHQRVSPPQLIVPKPSSIVRPGQGQPGSAGLAAQPPASQRPTTGAARPMRPVSQDDLEIPTFMRRQMD
jgi:cell division protein FtsZ